LGDEKSRASLLFLNSMISNIDHRQKDLHNPSLYLLGVSVSDMTSTSVLLSVVTVCVSIASCVSLPTSSSSLDSGATSASLPTSSSLDSGATSALSST